MQLMKTSNKKLYFFNPGHETAVQSGKSHYTPTASVRKMMTDLAVLPLWYGDSNNYILIDGSVDPSIFLMTIPEELRPALTPVTPTSLQTLLCTQIIEASPWGLSPHSIQVFKALQEDNKQLIIPAWNQEYAQLTARQTASEYLKLLQLKNADYPDINPPHFCTDIYEIKQYIANHPPPYVLKMPYSCSGRGLYWLANEYIDKLATQWINGAIRKQGSISIERALNKICDFAMEFESDGTGNIQYVGLSVFNTMKKGAFSGNLLGPQQVLVKQLTRYIPVKQLRSLQNEIEQLLSRQLGTKYKGHFGIDMLIYQNNDQSYAIHPFIELNLRYTMGLVALQLSKRLIHPRISGEFIISHEKDAYIKHQQMLSTYPLEIKEGKILAGYFPLCPVNPETNYRAYILINESTQK